MISIDEILKKLNLIKKHLKKIFIKQSLIESDIINNSSYNHIELLFYFIKIFAYLAEIDEETKPEELESIIEIFPKFLSAKPKIINIYNSAVADIKSLKNKEKYALQLAEKIKFYSPSNLELYKDLCKKLIIIADSDGPINNKEYDFIIEIGKYFGYSKSDIDNWVNDFLVAFEEDEYETLGLEKNNNYEIKIITNAYREKVMKFHPDKIYSYSDIPEIYKVCYQRKYEKIISSYKKIKENISRLK